METPRCLDDLDCVGILYPDRFRELVKQFKGTEICRENRAWLHGISFGGPTLKTRKTNQHCIRYIKSLLSEGWGSACEVNTRIYVRDSQGKWLPIPKRRFWASQCKLLWTAWRDMVDACLPWGEFDIQWCGRLMDQIGDKNEAGEYKYNPLTSPESRRQLKAIYKKFVFNRELYDKEKGKPGRKPT